MSGVPRPILLDDTEFDDSWVTKVSFGTDDQEFVLFEHESVLDPPFYLSRREARKLRNFLNKCLEVN